MSIPPEPALPFADLPGLIAAQARSRPAATALREGKRNLSYGQLDALMDRVAAALQHDGLAPEQHIAICAAASIEYLVVFMGALRAGLAVAPLAPGSTPQQLAAMALDANAMLVFVDTATAEANITWPAPVRLLDGRGQPGTLQHWLAAAGAGPRAVAIDPDWAFNLIYSSGTTGTPKGIVQPHAMRWAHIQRAGQSGYGPDTVTLIATPLYSNTTLVCAIPTLAYGGCVVLLPKFDVQRYLQLAQQHRAGAKRHAVRCCGQAIEEVGHQRHRNLDGDTVPERLSENGAGRAPIHILQPPHPAAATVPVAGAACGL